METRKEMINWGKGWLQVMNGGHFVMLKIGEWRFYASRGAIRKSSKVKKKMKFRALLHERTGGRCERCGRSLEVHQISIHHRLHKSLHPELRWELSNLEALCDDCHKELHKEGDRKVAAIRLMMEGVG